MKDRERRVLTAIVDEYVATAIAPTIGRVHELCDEIPYGSLGNIVLCLQADGAIMRPNYHGAGIKPVRDADGIRVEASARRVHP